MGSASLRICLLAVNQADEAQPRDMHRGLRECAGMSLELRIAADGRTRPNQDALTGKTVLRITQWLGRRYVKSVCS